MALDTAEIDHLAALARIGLTEEEKALFQEQLSHILEQFEVLEGLDTSNVLPTGHAVELQTVMREDKPEDSLPPEEVLNNAPRREGDFFRVKAVLEE